MRVSPAGLLSAPACAFCISVGLALASCGGAAAPPASAPATPSEPASPPATSAEPLAAPRSTADGGAAEPSSSPAAPTAPAPEIKNEPKTAGLIAEGHDDCALVAAPFEERVRAKFNECYQAGKKKNPELQGTVRVVLKVDVKGKVGKVVSDPSTLDASTVACMVKAVKKEPFDAKACRGKDVAVSKTFGAK